MTQSPSRSEKSNNSLNAEIREIKRSVKQVLSMLESVTSTGDLQTPITEFLKISNDLASLGTKISSLERERNNLLSLAEIGGTVNSTLDTNDVLKIVIDTIIQLTGAERSFLMLKNRDNELEMSVGRNWQQQTLSPEDLAISRTIAERVAENGEPILTTNAQQDPRYQDQASVIGLNLRSIMCAPLKTKDEIIGVIYTDNRTTSGLFSPAELTLLSALADQAAIAIQNAQLYQDLQITHEELQSSYDTTLEGWATALELRDQTTQEHTQRVTELTVQLGRFLGLDEQHLVHVRRGAILHDIGKMGVPDNILCKPEKLTSEEREIIQKHPQHAYDMLSQIQFLEPALDIPLCHHERWDGSGYPRGLKGEEIPLPARIFTVIDVWDALTSDRPYRKAMPEDQVIQYIEQLSGTHFDPRIVNAFKAMLAQSNPLI